MTEQIPDPVGEALAAAVRPPEPDPEGERLARAAFRAARDAGALDARPRRRDDWRPRRRRTRWSARAFLGAALASLAVGGVAVAGIGGPPDPGADRPAPRPAPTSTTAPGDAVTVPGPHTPPPSGRAPAHCKAYEAGRGTKRSERATQGCAEPSATGADHDRRDGSGGAGQANGVGNGSNSGNSGDSGNSGNSGGGKGR
ncbi:hypothetical protein [Streptomyces sp. NPDC050145]|uniref:hypothetical protein n=1 Tax=Streptomyces sp. NPDC050145 TaxID=3365602 RepID=UPI0037ABE835